MIPGFVAEQEKAVRATIASCEREIESLHDKMVKTLKAQAHKCDPEWEAVIGRHYTGKIQDLRGHISYLKTRIPPHTIWNPAGYYERAPVA